MPKRSPCRFRETGTSADPDRPALPDPSEKPPPPKSARFNRVTGPPDPMAYLNFVLHAHLPFVRHPEHARFLEEEWLYEAMTETYIPLLLEFDALERDNLPFRLT